PSQISGGRSTESSAEVIHWAIAGNKECLEPVGRCVSRTGSSVRRDLKGDTSDKLVLGPASAKDFALPLCGTVFYPVRRLFDLSPVSQGCGQHHLLRCGERLFPFSSGSALGPRA